MSLVFVYGTLKEGFPNFEFNGGSRLAGEFATLSPYPFYLVGERYVPCLINLPGAGFNVYGQAFSADGRSLAIMDELEEAGKPEGYGRTVITVACTETDERKRVFVYLKQPGQLKTEAIRLGPISRYATEHALLYRCGK